MVYFYVDIPMLVTGNMIGTCKLSISSSVLDDLRDRNQVYSPERFCLLTHTSQLSHSA